MFIFLWKVNFKVIVCAVKENTAEVPLVMLFITVVEQFDIFLIGFSDKGTTIVNLIFRNRNTMIKIWEYGRCRFGF